jgi:hypothetical protein
MAHHEQATDAPSRDALPAEHPPHMVRKYDERAEAIAALGTMIEIDDTNDRRTLTPAFEHV